ncbi:595_t:CDS:1, partial [Gigaspora margarita]
DTVKTSPVKFTAKVGLSSNRVIATLIFSMMSINLNAHFVIITFHPSLVDLRIPYLLWRYEGLKKIDDELPQKVDSE